MRYLSGLIAGIIIGSLITYVGWTNSIRWLNIFSREIVDQLRALVNYCR